MVISTVADATEYRCITADRGLKATAKFMPTLRVEEPAVAKSQMQNLDIAKTADAWAPLSQTLFVPHTESEYRQLVELLDTLIDESR